MSTARKRRRTPHQPTGTWIRKEKRLAIYLRDDFTCMYCTRKLSRGRPQEITLDHLRPRSQGGTNDPMNLVTACRTCNSLRAGMSVREFVSRIHLLPDMVMRMIHNTRRRRLPLALARDLLRDRNSPGSR